MNKTTEYKGFTIVDMEWGYHVYGTSAETMKYGFVRNFESVDEAINWINENI